MGGVWEKSTKIQAPNTKNEKNREEKRDRTLTYSQINLEFGFCFLEFFTIMRNPVK